MIETSPLIINALNAPFWNAAAERRLVLPFCPVSRRYFWPPSSVSPFDSRSNPTWREADVAGKLQSRIIYRRCFHKPFEPLMPYAVGLVRLDAGPRLLAFLAHPDDAASPRAGDRVRIDFAQLLPDGPWVTIVAKSRRGDRSA